MCVRSLYSFRPYSVLFLFVLCPSILRPPLLSQSVLSPHVLSQSVLFKAIICPPALSHSVICILSVCVGSPSVCVSWLMWCRRLYAFFTPCTILPRVYGYDFWSGCNIIFARVGNLHLLIYYTCDFLKSNNLTFCTCSCLVDLSPILHLWFFFLF